MLTNGFLRIKEISGQITKIQGMSLNYENTRGPLTFCVTWDVTGFLLKIKIQGI